MELKIFSKECFFCYKNLTTFHDPRDRHAPCHYFSYNCDKDAWLPSTQGYSNYNGNMSEMVPRYFKSKYNGNNICWPCDRKIDTLIEITCSKLNRVISQLQAQIQRLQIHRLKRMIQIHKDLDIIICEYLLE